MCECPGCKQKQRQEGLKIYKKNKGERTAVTLDGSVVRVKINT